MNSNQPYPTLTQFGKISLISIAQIMLQGSVLTGGLFLLAVVIESPIMASMMLLAVVTANITAIALKFDNTHLNQGLYGFSAALVGLFVAVFFGITATSLFLTLMGAMVAMLIQAVGLRHQLPLYTLPFIVVSWGLYVVATWLDIPTATLSTPTWHLAVLANDNGIIKATGQVMFLGSVLAGFLCLIGLGLNDIRQNKGKFAVFALMAEGVCWLLASLIGADKSQIALGLWGYNGVLIVLALADKKPWLWLIGIIIGIGIQWLFNAVLDFTIVGGFLTLPFVLAVWVIYLGESYLHPNK